MPLYHRITNEYERAKAVDAIESASLPCRMEIVSGDDRSLEQNRLQWQWMTEIGKATGNTPQEVHRECKAYIGVPILCRDSEDFAATYNECIRPLPYETKLRAMDLIDVTSIMTVPQMTEFLDGVKNRYPTIKLTDPNMPGVLR